jgi:glycosyltransferase involved in cell wall biosynthesis
MSKGKILFINDGSITNPIIHSQGLPLLSSLARNGFSCNFVSFENNTEELNTSIIKKEYLDIIDFFEIKFRYIKLIPNWLLFFYWWIITVVKIIKKKNISILHCRSLYPGVIALFIKLFYKRNIKIIYDNRGVFIDEEILKGHWKVNGAKENLFRKLEKLLLKKCDAQIVVSKHFCDYIVEQNITDIPNLEEKTFVITNGTKIYNTKTLQMIKRKNNNSFIGVYSGSAAKWQNLSEIKELFKVAINNFDNLFCKIISYNVEAFEKVFDNSEIDINKIEIESLASYEVWNSLALCNFGILLRENNLINNVAAPLKFAEYLSAGLPVLISKGVGDTEEIIKKYNVGVVIEDQFYKESLKDLLKLLEDETVYQRCMDVARNEFNIDNCFIEYENVYIEIANR